MNIKTAMLVLIMDLLFFASCGEEMKNDVDNYGANFEKEKSAILEVINNETKAAFNRDYPGWKDKWIHESYVVKTYMQFSDSSMTETLGWNEIDDFVRTYIEAHPEPDPLPTLVDKIDVRLYGNGAWVSFEQNDSERGLKRETRLMEKIKGEWKIAGMHTSIYGFDKKTNE